jgi:uncharacterized protein
MKDLLIRVSDISTRQPTSYTGDIPIQDLERLQEITTSAEGELSYSVEVNRKSSTLLLNGSAEGKMILTCDRCLEPFKEAKQVQFSLILHPATEQVDLAPEMVLSSEDLDTDYYDDDWLNLQEILEEQLLLELPVQKLCKESCQGICSGCGHNLNREACGCPDTIDEDHPFAILAQSKDTSGKSGP